jgi:alanine racemase
LSPVIPSLSREAYRKVILVNCAWTLPIRADGSGRFPRQARDDRGKRPRRFAAFEALTVHSVNLQRAAGPSIRLRGAILRENLKQWQHHTGSAIRAVIKANGYGFGLEQLVRELDRVVEGFVVSDSDELRRLRALSTAPAATLIDLGPEHANDVADMRGIGNIARLDSLASLARRADASELTVRIGLRLAAGWSAIDLSDAAQYARILASSNLAVELWMHLNNSETEREDYERFARFVSVFRRAGARIAGEDVESTVPAARNTIAGGSVRLGIGLFGARGSDAKLPSLGCAIAVSAPVVDRLTSSGNLRYGYEADALPLGAEATVLRCGYADGFPRVLRSYRSVLSVGMQYTVIRGRVKEHEVELLGPDDDLDELATAADVLPHQIVTGLGNASSLLLRLRHTVRSDANSG